MVEGARLESAYTLTGYRGFESLSLRQAAPRKRGVFVPGSVVSSLTKADRNEQQPAQRARLEASPLGKRVSRNPSLSADQPRESGACCSRVRASSLANATGNNKPGREADPG